MGKRRHNTGSGADTELTILMPCLNESQTVGRCIETAESFLREHDIRGEILVADNGSTDGSEGVAYRAGARVIRVRQRGYGRVLRAGIRAARGEIIIMGDCDMTYDFSDIWEMYRMLKEGYDMVIGDRFAGGIEPGAMIFSHRIGVKVLSFLGRIRYNVKVWDFHCGLRGLTREAAAGMRFRTTGMEFATEMIAEAAGIGLRMGEVPVRLRKCGFERDSKLRTLRDGFRHLALITGFGSVIE